MNRYDKCGVLSGAILFCKSKKKGQLDRDRKKFLNELYTDENTRAGLVKYIFGDDKIDIPPYSLKPKVLASINKSKNENEVRESESLRNKIKKIMLANKLKTTLDKQENIEVEPSNPTIQKGTVTETPSNEIKIDNDKEKIEF